MEFRVLGPLGVVAGGRHVTPGSERRRTVLAVLLAAGGEVVSTGRLVEAVWGSSPPSSDKTVRSHVSRLRGELAASDPRGSEVVVTEADGYRIDLGLGDLDAARFEDLLARARTARDDDPAAAVALFDEAEALWRGPAFGELATCEIVRVEAVRLDQLRVTASEERIEVQLALGRHGQVIAELEARVAAEPLAEQAHGQLMLALYGSGRQAEALVTYRAIQDRLREELGVDPSPRLQALHGRVLRQDPDLAPRPVRPGRSARRSAGVDGRTAGEERPPQVSGSGGLIGRDDDLERLATLVAEAGLVTLTGPGGVGKTRLAEQVALEVVPDAGDRVVTVGLASVHDPERVGAAVLSALDVPQLSHRPAEEALVAALGTRQLLLLLDNCEHVLASVSQLIASVWRSCPNVAVLATSREPLRLPGERVWRVAPLSVPAEEASAAEVAASPAGALFCSRAAAAELEFELTEENTDVVAELCRRLDGMPLAIELAAARVRAMAPADLLERLSDRFAVLTGGPPNEGGRHRTLAAVVAWSYDLLDEREARLFERLSVFVGPFSLEAAEQVCAGGGLDDSDVAGVLAELVDKSMVSVERRDAVVRYRLLDTLRAYGAARLAETGVRDALRRAHADHHVGLAEELGRKVRGPGEKAASAEIDAVLNDLRISHEWLVEVHDLDGALRLPAALCDYLIHRLRDEVATWAEQALALHDAETHPAYPAALATGAFGAMFRSDVEVARARARAVLARADRGDLATYYALGALRAVAMQDGQIDELLALDELSTAVGDALDDDYVRASLGWQRVLAHLYSGRKEDAGVEVVRLEAFAAASGNPTVQAHLRYCHGEILLESDPREAARHLETSLQLSRDVGSHLTTGAALVTLASLHGRQGDHDRALARFHEAIRHWQRFGGEKHQLTALRNLIGVLVAIDADKAAARLLGSVTAASAPSYGIEAERVAAARDELVQRLGEAELDAIAEQTRHLTVGETAEEALAVLDPLLGR